jgi:transglutaminase-like putative cysteine protease
VKLFQRSSDIDGYLGSSEFIDHTHPDIQEVARDLCSCAKKKIKQMPEEVSVDLETEIARITFEYVRDVVAHSADIQSNTITIKASEVLKKGEGICYAKSHLLAALLRNNGIPTALCYQLLRLDQEVNVPIILHGLNAVFLRSVGQWIRLDARGNKPGIHAQFSLQDERLAFSADPNMGEKDIPILFDEPDRKVLEKLLKYTHLSDLMKDLPDRVAEEY